MMVEQLLLNGIIAGSIYSLVALGFSLIKPPASFILLTEPSIHSAPTLPICFTYSLVTEG